MTTWNDMLTSEKREIDWLSDRIQSWIDFKMPDGGWITFSLGIFLLSSPNKEEKGKEVYRNIDAFDGLIILQEDKFTERYTINSGTKYIDAVISILESAGITKYNIEDSDKALSSTLEYEPGTEKSKPIADLLSAINFTPIWVDDYGYFTSSYYISPQRRAEDYVYQDDDLSVTYNGMNEEMDLTAIANKWTAIYSNADNVGLGESNGDPYTLSSTYENNNPDSPTSITNRGRTIVDFRKVEDIADQESLDNYVERLAFESSQVYGKIKFMTAIMPFHAYSDIVSIRNQTLGIHDKYSETSWRIKLEAGGQMEHEARRVVSI